ncbi:MAG: hypothetical protein WD871_02225 [Xanthobacteraceae bacterium]
MTKGTAICTAALFAFLASDLPNAAAQDKYMKAAPSDASKGAVAAADKGNSAKGKTPTITTRCVQPGSNKPIAC